MPFLPLADDCVEEDREGDQRLQRRLLELEVGRHECAKAEADGDSAEEKVEDVPAAVGLREMRREPIGPAIGMLERTEWRREIVSLGAAGAMPAPFVAGLRIGMVGGEIARAEAAHARGAEQQGIFDPHAEA